MTAQSPADLAALKARLYAALKHEKSCLCGECSGGLNAVDALVARCQELEREVELANFDGHYDRAVAAEAERDEARGQATEAENERVEWQNRCAAAEARVAELEQALRGGGGMIAVERRRQVDSEGWTPDHDDKHLYGDLARAGAAYAINDEDAFPWPDWWKPGDDDVRRLVKAGALIAAEIDRLVRAALAGEGEA